MSQRLTAAAGGGGGGGGCGVFDGGSRKGEKWDGRVLGLGFLPWYTSQGTAAFSLPRRIGVCVLYLLEILLTHRTVCICISSDRCGQVSQLHSIERAIAFWKKEVLDVCECGCFSSDRRRLAREAYHSYRSRSQPRMLDWSDRWRRIFPRLTGPAVYTKNHVHDVSHVLTVYIPLATTSC